MPWSVPPCGHELGLEFVFRHAGLLRAEILNVEPEVLECYSVTGDFDYVIKVVARDLKSLSQLLMDKLMRLPGVDSVRSRVCLDEIKCTGALPLPS